MLWSNKLNTQCSKTCFVFILLAKLKAFERISQKILFQHIQTLDKLGNYFWEEMLPPFFWMLSKVLWDSLTMFASFQAPDGESQPSTEVDLFISTEKIMVLNTDLKVSINKKYVSTLTKDGKMRSIGS